MRIVHGLRIDKSLRSQFAKAGVDLKDFETAKDADLPFVILTLSEDSLEWARVKHLVQKHKVFELADAEFSRDEIETSDALAIASTWFAGYPEPSNDFGYLDVSYDLSDYCDVCGIGHRQKAPIRLAKEPSWGRRQTLQLNWLHDEIFVNKDTWTEVFRPFDIECWPVHSKQGKELDSVVQLRFVHESSLHLTNDWQAKPCKKCRRVKYLPDYRGYAGKPSQITGAAFKSVEWFGDGGEGSRQMYVNRELGKVMRAHKLNCNYRACP